ncbi:MAG: hypothetical protein GY861_12705 [bacterium]|nr:hypothetical protein [bacterium]
MKWKCDKCSPIDPCIVETGVGKGVKVPGCIFDNRDFKWEKVEEEQEVVKVNIHQMREFNEKVKILEKRVFKIEENDMQRMVDSASAVLAEDERMEALEKKIESHQHGFPEDTLKIWESEKLKIADERISNLLAHNAKLDLKLADKERLLLEQKEGNEEKVSTTQTYIGDLYQRMEALEKKIESHQHGKKDEIDWELKYYELLHKYSTLRINSDVLLSERNSQ